MVTKSTKALDPKDFPDAKSYMIAKTEQENRELISVQLPKDNQNYKDDVIVIVNGKRWAIKRGVPVQVPRLVYDQLAHAEHQVAIVSTMLEAKSAAMANYGKL